MQSGIARSYNWIRLALAPTYVLRQIALIALMGLAYVAGLPMDAVTTMLVCLITVWGCTLGQSVFLNRRLTTVVEPGPKAYAPRTWLTTSAPISLVEGFYVLLTYSDVIVLTSSARRRRSPSITPRPRPWRWSPSSISPWRRRSRTNSPNITSPATASGSPISWRRPSA